jgi:hypothetical protein
MGLMKLTCCPKLRQSVVHICVPPRLPQSVSDLADLVLQSAELIGFEADVAPHLAEAAVICSSLKPSVVHSRLQCV